MPNSPKSDCFEVAPAGDTPLGEVHAKVQLVAERANEWSALPAADKRALLKECLVLLRQHTDELKSAACKSRGYDRNAPEDLHLVADATVLSFVLTASWLRGGIDLMDSLAERGQPPRGQRVIPRPNGSCRVRFEPGRKEWMLGMCTRELVVRDRIPLQRDPLAETASVTGILGAGNVEVLSDIIDALCRLNSVVVYKCNPVMEHSNRAKEKILEPLIRHGYLVFVYGGAEQGRAIVESQMVDKLTMTGSHHTFDKIMWGDLDKTDLSQKPVLRKPFISELGSVNPHIVVPGDAAWSDADLEAQAEALVANKLVNNGHLCASPQVLVTCREWPQRRAFLDAVRRKIAAARPPRCFYPGAEKQHAGHLKAMGEAAFVQPQSDSTEARTPTPLIFLEDLRIPKERSEAADPMGLRDEAFGCVLYEVALNSNATLPAFLPVAVDFCHERLWGNLSCTVVVDDATRAHHQDHFEQILDSMQFGTIGVNCPPGLACSLPQLTWGGFPGNDERDVQSGIGRTGNLSCYENVEKSIMYGHFRNLQTFQLAESPQEAMHALVRADLVAAVFSKRSFLNITNLANFELAKAARRHKTVKTLAKRVADVLARRPVL